MTEKVSKNPIRDPDAFFLKGEVVICDPARPCRYCGHDEFRILDIGEVEVFGAGRHLVWCRVRWLGCNTRIGRLRDLSVFPLNKRDEVLKRSRAARSWSAWSSLTVARWGITSLMGLTAIASHKLHLAGLCLLLAFDATVAAALWVLLVRPRLLMATEIKRWQSGKCPACGSDLRAAPDRCRKCGAAVAPKDS